MSLTQRQRERDLLETIQLLEKYYEDGQEDPNVAAKIAARLRRHREEAGLTAQDAAGRLEVSVQTLHRWERIPENGQSSSLPPLVKVYRYRKLFADTSDRHPSPLSPVPQWAIHALEYVVDHEALASDVYLVKGDRPYLSGSDVNTAFQMVNHIKSGVKFHFVFPEKALLRPSERPGFDDSEASRSCRDFLTLAHDHLSSSELGSIRVTPLTTASDVHAVGLSHHHIGVIALKYPTSDWRKVNRKVSVLFEMTLARFVGDPSADVLAPNGDLAYVESSSLDAERYLKTLLSILHGKEKDARTYLNHRSTSRGRSR